MARKSDIAKAISPADDEEAPSTVREVPVPAVTRAAAMLRLLSTSPAPLGVNQIARDLDIIPSTCLHILRTLTAEGLVAVDPVTKRYRLGLQILTLAKSALRESIGERAQPYLDEIVRTHGVTALAVSASGPDHYVVTALSHSPQAIRLHVDLGSRFPALISATGRCVAAYSNKSARQIRSEFEKLHWYDPPSYGDWIEQVGQVLARGYAIDDGNYLSGVGIVASPILGKDGKFQHAIVAVCIRDRLQKIGLDALAADIKASAINLAEQIK